MGQAGDFDYESHGRGYAQRRRADPRIARWVHDALGDARTVLNVGAGAGSYEPVDRYVLALEPSESMRAQRSRTLAPAICGSAESIPLDDGAVDAAMAMVTVHHWPDLQRGLRELRRVSRGPVLILTFDRDALDRYWMPTYAPEYVVAERRRYPALDAIAEALGGRTTVHSIPIPIDCTDGFTEAFYARPEAFLDDDVRRSQSGWGFVEAAAQRRFVEHLAADLASGEWDRLYGSWRTRPEFDGSLRLLVAER
jgi:SAM-dependent methyltransferase